MSAIYQPKGRALEYSHLACNLYKGCGHCCFYCYAPDVLKLSREEFTKPEPRVGILEMLWKDAQRYAATARRVLLCFTCDPYQPIEKEHRLTEKALEILGMAKIPFQILTKAGTLPIRDFHLYGRDDAFAVTLTSLEQEDQKKWEPQAGSPSARIAALIEAHKQGIETWVSLEPVIDLEKSIRIIKETRDFVDLYKIGTLNHVDCDILTKEWESFGRRAINLCTAYGKKYYIKHDLQVHLGTFPFQNTDTRTVKAICKSE